MNNNITNRIKGHVDLIDHVKARRKLFHQKTLLVLHDIELLNVECS